MNIVSTGYRPMSPVRAGGGATDPAATPNSDTAASGMRMAAPVLRTYQDVHAARLAYLGRANGYMGNGFGMGGGLFRSGYSSYGGYGGMGYQGYGMNGLRGNFGAMAGGMRSISKLIGGSFIFSALMSGISNLMELAKGQKSPQQALGSFVADTAAYTAIGTAATMVGGLIGSFLLPIPFLGTLLGVAAGAGISWLLGSLYEQHLRPQLSASMTQSIGGMMNGNTAQPTTPTA